MKDVQPECILWNDLARITPKGRKAPYLLQKGDIIFSGRGTKIFSQAITIEPKSITVSSQFFILSPKEEFLSEYILWYINSAQGQKYFWTYAGGSSIINVTRSIIEDFPIPIPPESELKTITSLIRAMKREFEIIT